MSDSELFLLEHLSNDGVSGRITVLYADSVEKAARDAQFIAERSRETVRLSSMVTHHIGTYSHKD
jgi:hypothetical protein